MVVKLPVEVFYFESIANNPIRFLCRPEASSAYNFDFSFSAASNLLSR